jgi:xanthine dehydrogenase iron-sulfur cluster and FAD-binding subunit A
MAHLQFFLKGFPLCDFLCARGLRQDVPFPFHSSTYIFYKLSTLPFNTTGVYISAQNDQIRADGTVTLPFGGVVADPKRAAAKAQDITSAA